MGEFTDHGGFKPGIGEEGWGDLVNANTDLLESVLAGGVGSGSGLPWVNIAAEPFNADPTGFTSSSSAIKAAGTAIVAAGSGVLYAPKGAYKVSGKLLHAEPGTGAPGEGIVIMGDGPGLTTFVIEGPGGALWGSLGRHGYGKNEVTAPIAWRSHGYSNPDGYAHDVGSGLWQSQDMSWEDLLFDGIIGAGVLGVGMRRPTMRNVAMLNCGDSANGMPAVSWQHSDEGGLVGRLTEYGLMENVRILNTDPGQVDMAVYWTKTLGCKAIACDFDGSGPGRSTMVLLDTDACQVVGSRIANGAEDSLQLQTYGNSRRNLIVGNITGRDDGDYSGASTGMGFGINEYVGTGMAGQVFGSGADANVIENNVGTVNRA